MHFARIYTKIDKRPSRAALAVFGATLFASCALLAGVMQWLIDKPLGARWLLVFGLGMAVGSIIPGLGRVLYVGWMGLGVTLGLVGSPVMLAALYYLVIVPFGLIMKPFRRDPLRRQLDRSASSYWQAYAEPEDPARYLKQF